MLIRSFGWLLVFSLFAPALVCAQAPAAPGTTRRERALAAELDVDSVELVALEKEMAHAISLNNPSFFQRGLSDDYRGASTSGEVLNKSAVVTRIQTSSAKYYNFIVTDIYVRVYGASAVVTCTWTARGEQNGHVFARQYRVIHVYVNNKAGGWKIVAGQETQLPG